MSTTKVTCPSCGVTLKSATPVPAGKRARCPKCSTSFVVPGDETKPIPPARTAGERPSERPESAPAKQRPTPSKQVVVPRARIPDDERDEGEHDQVITRRASGRTRRSRWLMM